jgi:hypothetical protein
MNEYIRHQKQIRILKKGAVFMDFGLIWKMKQKKSIVEKKVF